MTGPPGLRRAVLRHVVLSAVIAAVICGLVTAGVLVSARRDAAGNAERVARQVAAAVVVPLSRRDFSGPVDQLRGELGRSLTPFLSSGMVRRVKVWVPDGDGARIAYSDEPRLEGERVAPDPAVTRPRPPDEVLVRAVPDDFEHRFEAGAGPLLEVFIGFRDAGGRPAQLELYVPTDAAGAAERTATAVLPLLLGGLAVLALTTLPLSVRLARRLERERAEQRAARRFGLASAEATRLELARHLHNGAIPDLAGARMLLELARARVAGTDDSRELLDRAHDLVDAEVRRLRGILDDLVPADTDGLPSLAELVERLRRQAGEGAPPVDVTVSAPDTPRREVCWLLQWVAEELVRNALRHARARRVWVALTSEAGIGVRLTVGDDGVGVAAGPAATSSGVGLRLAARVIEDHGGRMTVSDAPGGGTTVDVVLPPDTIPDRDPTNGRGVGRLRLGAVPGRR